MHAILPFFICFFLHVLSRLYLTSKILNNDQKIDQQLLFYCPVVQAPYVACRYSQAPQQFFFFAGHANKSASHKKVEHLCLLGLIPMINHYFLALVLLYSMSLELSS